MDINQTIYFPTHQENQVALARLVFTEGYSAQVSFRYDIKAGKYKHIGDIQYESEDTSNNYTSIVTRLGGAIAKIDHYNDDRMYVEIFAHHKKIAYDTFTLIKKQLPPAPEVVDNDLKVRFWYLSPQGAVNVTRTITVPDWEEVKSNYADSTRKGLDDLMYNFKPEGGGKIILWHGLPGTGKTYALRALTQQWKKWATIDYILDPEALFGHSAGYLTQMIFSQSPTEYDEFDDPIPGTKDKWKFLIMEDTGELLSENAKDRAGQGLSRLLNLADGFIGQGLKVLILITTNEELDKLHPAVSRQGRCAAAIHFAPFTNEDAKNWAKANGLVLPSRKEPWTLADLYGLKTEGKIEVVKNDRKEAPLGFQIPA